MTGIYASRMRATSGGLKPLEVTTPTPLPSPVMQFMLQPGEARGFLRPRGSIFEIDARIDVRLAKGAAYLLAVSAAGQPLGPLLNKAGFFKYVAGKGAFPYCGPNDTWNVFYSPDFSTNNDSGQAYRYKWKLPSVSSPGLADLVEVKLRHVGDYEGRVIHRPLIVRL